eukprot:3693275-Rhodomonas_salina.1
MRRPAASLRSVWLAVAWRVALMGHCQPEAHASLAALRTPHSLPSPDSHHSSPLLCSALLCSAPLHSALLCTAGASPCPGTPLPASLSPQPSALSPQPSALSP